MTFFHTTCSIYFLQIFLNLSDLAILQTEISIINFEEYGNTLSMCRHLNSWSFSIIAMALGNFVTLVPRMSKILKFCKFLILSGNSTIVVDFKSSSINDSNCPIESGISLSKQHSRNNKRCRDARWPMELGIQANDAQ